jgi:hypothetical protein
MQVASKCMEEVQLKQIHVLYWTYENLLAKTKQKKGFSNTLKINS